MKTDKITRYGAYGVLFQEGKILLAQKKSGPYKGLWGLPGGQIEFGETPEETLERELIEETALQAGPLQLLSIATFTGNYQNAHFHHIGIIYKVSAFQSLSERIPEEKTLWEFPKNLQENMLTPFAKHVLNHEAL